MTNITTIALGDLRLSNLNVRKVKPSGIETLADDIAAHGVIQSLAVYEEEGTYHVFAGGRRYRALKHLQKAKTIGADYPVPVTIRSKSEAIELSTAENVQREAMHPADQVRAFEAMRAEGHTQGEIAARFGYSEGHVARLLKLGSLDKTVLKALANDEISLEVAKAIALSDDPKMQREALKQCGNNAYSVRRLLSEDKMKTSDRLFRFIGREHYEKAGGTITIDLFSEGGEGYADDRDLVEQEAHAKLSDIAEAIRAEGWSKVRAELDTPSDYYSLRPMYPTERGLSEEEAAKLAKIEDDLAEAEEAEDEDAWERLDGEREAMLATIRHFTDEQKAIGGVIVTVDYNGTATLKHYYAVTPKAEQSGAGEGEAKTEADYSAKLVEDMRALQTLALQQEVAADPALALDILLDTLAASLLHGRWTGETGLALAPRVAFFPVPDDLHDSRIVNTAEDVAQRFASLPAANRFATIRAMSDEDKRSLLAALVAVMIEPKAANGAYAEAAALDMRNYWSVSVPFADRLTKKQALSIMADECGSEAAANCAKLKKAEIAVQLAERLPHKWLPEPMRVLSPSPQTDDEESSEAA